jgi:hypothetical protein
MKHTVFIICSTSTSPKLTYFTHNSKIWTTDLEEAAIWFNKETAQLFIENFTMDTFQRQVEALNRERVNRYTQVKYKVIYDSYIRQKQTIKPLEIIV